MNKVIWITLITAAVLTAGLLVYILFFRIPEPPPPTFLGDAKLTITAAAESASGSEISYEIKIKNSSNAKLTGMQLEIFYPSGFSFLDSTPDLETPGARTYAFADLQPLKEDRLVIVGNLTGSLREVKIFTAKLHYVPENFRSSFVTEASVSTVVTAPDLSLRLLAPAQVVTGQIMTYEVKIQNLASRVFNDLLLRLTLPEKFDTESQKELTIGNLREAEVKSFFLSGKILEEAGIESFAEAELLFKNPDGESGTLARAFAFTQIRPSPLLLSHELINPPPSIIEGQKLRYAVNYENRGDVGLKNVVIAVVFETAEVFDFSQMETQTGQLLNKSLRFLPASIPELQVVAPQASGKFEFAVSISQDLVGRLQKNPKAQTRVEFSSQELPEPLLGNRLEFKLQSQVEVKAEALKVDGQYEIKLSVSNTVNDLAEVELRATIPGGSTVFLADTIEPLEERALLSYVPSSGRVSWRIDRMFAFSGSFHEARELRFKLLSSDPALLRDIQVSGTDEFTGAKVFSNKIDSLTAN